MHREYRGAVTCLSSLEGYLLLTIGNKLEMHQWTGSNLLRTAFFDAPMLITSLNVVKTFILFGDVHKSIYFVQYRDQVWTHHSTSSQRFGALCCKLACARVVLWCAALGCAVLCSPVLCRAAVLARVVRYCVMPCYAPLCCVVLRCPSVLFSAVMYS